jgi:hypothetical protein
VTDEFASPYSPYGLRNQQRTVVTGDTWIQQPKGTQKSVTNCSHGRRMDSTSETAPTHSDITNEVLSRVTDEFANPNSPYGRINQQRTAVTGDSWIRQPKQPPGTQISATNCCYGSRMDSTAQRSPRHSDIIDELLSRVKDGFDSPNSTYGLRNHQRTAATCDTWIRQPQQPLGTQISPTNCCDG